MKDAQCFGAIGGPPHFRSDGVNDLKLGAGTKSRSGISTMMILWDFMWPDVTRSDFLWPDRQTCVTLTFLRRDSERLGEPRGGVGGWGWLMLCPTERPMGMLDTPLEPSWHSKNNGILGFLTSWPRRPQNSSKGRNLDTSYLSVEVTYREVKDATGFVFKR